MSKLPAAVLLPLSGCWCWAVRLPRDMKYRLCAACQIVPGFTPNCEVGPFPSEGLSEGLPCSERLEQIWPYHELTLCEKRWIYYLSFLVDETNIWQKKLKRLLWHIVWGYNDQAMEAGAEDVCHIVTPVRSKHSVFLLFSQPGTSAHWEERTQLSGVLTERPRCLSSR